MTLDTSLTESQHRTLEREASHAYPPIVVGWDERERGPVILTRSGHFCTLTRRGALRERVA